MTLPEVFRRYDIRGKVPEEIDAEMIEKLGRALGTYWNSGRIAVGRDGRNSSPAFYEAAISGLESTGADVEKVDLSTTDMLSVIVKERFDAGVQITASHMPPEYGGIKPLNSDGRILENSEMADVKQIYLDEDFQDGDGLVSSMQAPESLYRSKMRNRFHELFETDLEGLKIVVDPGNGMGALVMPGLLKELGADIEILNGSIDGDFPGRDPKPSDDAVEELKKQVRSSEADLGVATDGDADRAMFVDENGRFVSGDEVLAIAGEKYLEEDSRIVCSANTSQMVEEHIHEKGGEILYVPPGAVFTALKTMETGTVFGGQPNGHLMDRELTPYDSGTFFAAVVPGIMNEQGEKLSEIISGLPEYRIEKLNLDAPKKEKQMGDLKDWIEQEYGVEKDHFSTVKFSTDKGTVNVRPSGSEPVIRFTFESKNDVNALKNDIRQNLDL